MAINRFPFTEITVAVSFVLCMLWLLNDYIAFFISLFLSSISFVLLMISYITELIEKSNLPSWYFKIMWMLVMLPPLIAIVFGLINGFDYQWQKG